MGYATSTPMQVIGIKLRLAETHARILVSRDAVTTPGVDVRGADFNSFDDGLRAFKHAIAAYEPGEVLLHLLIEWDARRMVVVFEAPLKPRPLRLHAAAPPELWEIADAFRAEAQRLAETRLAARNVQLR
jgi:hypothetical protein